MDIKLKKRYNGIIPIDRYCQVIGNHKFDFLFSFRVIDVIDEENNKFLISFFNPQLANCILTKYPDFKFYYKKGNKNFLASANVIKNGKAEAEIKINKDLSIPEKRRYNRFKISQFDLPPFSIYSDGKKLIENARILEISLRGLQIFAPEFSFNDENLLEIINEDENINIGLVKPVLVEKNEKGVVIRGEIKKTNINMTKFMIETYIKVAKDIIKTNCKKG